MSNNDYSAVNYFAMMTEVEESSEPAPVFKRSHLIEQMEQAGVFYDVQLLDNLFPMPPENLMGAETEARTTIESTGKRTVVNMDLRKAIGVVSDKYVPVLNQDIFTQFDEILLNVPDLDLTDAYVDVQTNRDGATILVQYVFPAHKVILSGGDAVVLRIVALNSFDGSTGFKVFCGAIRMACMNGMLTGERIAYYQKKHCSGLSIADAGRAIENGLTAYLNDVDKWNIQINCVIDGSMFFRVLAEMCDLDDLGATCYATYKAKQVEVGKTRRGIIDDYMILAADYCDELGQTEWALNNVLTHIATHGARKNGAKPSIASQVSKSEKAQKLMKKYLSQGA